MSGIDLPAGQPFYKVALNTARVYQKTMAFLLPVILLGFLMHTGLYVLFPPERAAPIVAYATFLPEWHQVILTEYFPEFLDYIFIGFFIQAMSLLIIDARVRNQTVDWRGSFITAIKKYPVLVVLGVAINTLASFGYLFYAVPGLLVSVMFMLFVPIIVFENKGIISGFVQAARMVGVKHFVHVMLSFILVIAFLTMLAELLLVLVGSWLSIDVTAALISFSGLPFFFSYVYVQYHNVK